jgi:hypothetical protein
VLEDRFGDRGDLNRVPDVLEAPSVADIHDYTPSLVVAILEEKSHPLEAMGDWIRCVSLADKVSTPQ